MAHQHHGDAKRTQHTKAQKMIGDTAKHYYAADKADKLAYTANKKLDPLTRPTQEIGSFKDEESV